MTLAQINPEIPGNTLYRAYGSSTQSQFDEESGFVALKKAFNPHFEDEVEHIVNHSNWKSREKTPYICTTSNKSRIERLEDCGGLGANVYVAVIDPSLAGQLGATFFSSSEKIEERDLTDRIHFKCRADRQEIWFVKSIPREAVKATLPFSEWSEDPPKVCNLSSQGTRYRDDEFSYHEYERSTTSEPDDETGSEDTEDRESNSSESDTTLGLGGSSSSIDSLELGEMLQRHLVL